MSFSVDLLFTGGTVHTGVDTGNPVDAVAVKNGRIAAVGRSEELGGLACRQKIELNGKVLVPGFIDAHCHLSLFSMLLRYLDCRLPLNADMDELLNRISRQSQNTPPGQWIRGWGFADYKMKERRYPTRRELDEAAPSNPVSILHVSGHSVVVNSLALKEAGVGAKTPDPAGGQIERDPQTGEPGGVLHETAMQPFSHEAMYMEFLSLSPDTQLDIIEKGTRAFAGMGITTACDAAAVPPVLSVYQLAERAGALRCRVTATPYYEWSQATIDSGLLSNFGSEWFKVGAVKLLGDGSLSGRTAAVSKPYEGTQNTGILYRDQAALDQIVMELDAKGLQIATHAIGDRAIDQALNAYKRVIDPGKGNTRRHRMEHVGILNKDLLKRLAELDVTIATQPRMLYEQGDGFYRSCGEKRMALVYPYRSFLEAGLHVAGSSDCPVVSADPVLGMQDAILRRTEEGRIVAPDQRLDPEQALYAFTQGGAYSLFDEKEKGTIEEGKLADMVVLSADPLKTPADAWENKMLVEMTITGGEIVYSADVIWKK